MSRDDSDETCADPQCRRTGRQLRQSLLADGLCHADSIAFGDDGTGRSGCEIEDGKRSALLFELNVEGGELACWCIDGDVERAPLPDHGRLIDGDRRTLERARVVIRYTERKSRQDKQTEEPPDDTHACDLTAP